MDKEQIIEALREFVMESPNPYPPYDLKKVREIQNNGESSLRSEEWITGGQTGENPWGDVVGKEKEPEHPCYFEQLYKFLEKTFPEMTYAQMDEINDRIKPMSFSDEEYYGNTTHYKIYDIEFKELAEIVVEAIERRNEIENKSNNKLKIR